MLESYRGVNVKALDYIIEYLSSIGHTPDQLNTLAGNNDSVAFEQMDFGLLLKQIEIDKLKLLLGQINKISRLEKPKKEEV